MAYLSDRLRSIKDARQSRGILIYCPGCEGAHVIWYQRADTDKRQHWTWNGNVDRPTCTPSVRLLTRDAKGYEVTECHFFLKDGNIEYCDDSAHDLRGRIVPIPKWPYEEFGGEE